MKEFKKTIQELYEYLQEYEGPTDRFSELVQKNVIDWLFGHIKTYDRSVAKFIFMKQIQIDAKINQGTSSLRM